jgi:ribosomal protein S12 methylthiotransferase accessory factor
MCAGTSWLLVDPSPLCPTLGAMFIPGRTGCWECLTFRLGRLRPAEAYLHARCATTFTVPDRLTAQGAESALRSRSALEWVVRRPGCPSCGDDGHVEARRREPPQLNDTPVRPQARHLLDPFNGVTTGLKRLRSASPHASHVFVAAPAGDGRASDLASLRRVLASRATGSGTTRNAALRAVIGEAVERHCGIAYGDERDVRATLAQLGDDAIPPNECMLFSTSQYSARAAANRIGDSATRVPVPLHESARIDWTVVWSLSTGRRRFVPTAYVVRGSPRTLGSKYCVADTNGCAAGKTLADTVVRGFLELVERDAIAIWWYNRLDVPRLDNDSTLIDERASSTSDARRPRESWLLDLTTDLGIPVIAAISRRLDSPCERLVFGFGASWRIDRAARHAIREMAQMATLADRIPDATLQHDARVACKWLRTASCEEQRFLRGSSSATRIGASVSERVPRRGSQVALHCAELAARHGMDLCVFDQTRADVGFPVARVMAPGLRPAVPRFAPGRLFTVPQSLRSIRAATEAELNPWPFVW